VKSVSSVAANEIWEYRLRRRAALVNNGMARICGALASKKSSSGAKLGIGVAAKA